MLVILASFPDLRDLPPCACAILASILRGLCRSLSSPSESLVDALESANPSFQSAFRERRAIARNSGKVTAETGCDAGATTWPSESGGVDAL